MQFVKLCVSCIVLPISNILELILQIVGLDSFLPAQLSPKAAHGRLLADQLILNTVCIEFLLCRWIIIDLEVAVVIGLFHPQFSEAWWNFFVGYLSLNFERSTFQKFGNIPYSRGIAERRADTWHWDVASIQNQFCIFFLNIYPFWVFDGWTTFTEDVIQNCKYQTHDCN